ncbi:MAG: ATP-binding cassette domain-containing protein, partial [Acidimicrobiales bacterium]|nr:ATP-binding cassette domain-containing protein [Acidimicrobiales bacterium]
MSLLELRSVSGGYGPINVLSQLDLSVNEGEVAVILGANGAGKTTTLRAICGILESVTGEIVFDGVDISKMS